jgi:hypothetical protein
MPEPNDDFLQKLIAATKGGATEQGLRELLAAAAKSAPSQSERLQELYSLYTKTYTFSPGDLVGWKPGLRDRNYPADGAPAIVLEVLKAAIFDGNSDAGTPYFREPYDIVAGLIASDGIFHTYHFNSMRLAPYVPPQKPSFAQGLTIGQVPNVKSVSG